MPQPWYRQFWPWFLIGLPLCVVIASLYTAILASRDGVNLVAEDYYKQGKEINQDLSKFDKAQALGLSFTLTATDDELVLRKQSGTLAKGEALHLSFFHPTLPGRDSEQLLTADANGAYRLLLNAPLSGKWHVRIDAFNHAWRLQETLYFPLTEPRLLDPKGR